MTLVFYHKKNLIGKPLKPREHIYCKSFEIFSYHCTIKSSLCPLSPLLLTRSHLVGYCIKSHLVGYCINSNHNNINITFRKSFISSLKPKLLQYTITNRLITINAYAYNYLQLSATHYYKCSKLHYN